jgi:hypothetical protein
MGRRRKRAVFPPWAVFLPPSLGCFSSLPPLFDFAFLKKGGGGK